MHQVQTPVGLLVGQWEVARFLFSGFYFLCEGEAEGGWAGEGWSLKLRFSCFLLV